MLFLQTLFLHPNEQITCDGHVLDFIQWHLKKKKKRDLLMTFLSVFCEIWKEKLYSRKKKINDHSEAILKKVDNISLNVFQKRHLTLKLIICC